MVNEWTRADLPISGQVLGETATPDRYRTCMDTIDCAVAHLNDHHPKPGPDRLERQAATISELQGSFLRVERDAARWRRAHEIVERERDQAREQRAVAERERNDLRRQVEDLTERRQNLVRERDLDAKLAKCMSDFQDMEDECDMWRARAEAAEARTAPAVTKRELRSVVAAHDPGDDELAVSRVNALTDRLWSLVSGADPAVHVVRESEVAAVEVRRASDGWYADGAWLASADETAEWVRDRAAEMVVCAARNEAVARAIKAEPADPLLDKAQEFAALADWELTDREAELLHTVAAHVLGREVK